MLFLLTWIFSLQKGFSNFMIKIQEYIEIGSQGQVVLLLPGFSKNTVLDIKDHCEHNYVLNQPKFESFSVTCQFCFNVYR